MKPFKLNWSFHCLSKAWFYCSNICFGTISQTTMGRIHACCRETDYVANTRFLSLVLTQIFRILLRFYSDFTHISAQKNGYWDLCKAVQYFQKELGSDQELELLMSRDTRCRHNLGVEIHPPRLSNSSLCISVSTLASAGPRQTLLLCWVETSFKMVFLSWHIV